MKLKFHESLKAQPSVPPSRDQQTRAFERKQVLGDPMRGIAGVVPALRYREMSDDSFGFGR